VFGGPNGEKVGAWMRTKRRVCNPPMFDVGSRKKEKNQSPLYPYITKNGKPVTDKKKCEGKPPT